MNYKKFYQTQKNSCILCHYMLLYKSRPGVAQLVARLTGGQEAVSSSLATRTKSS